jgi:hypothetical protein
MSMRGVALASVGLHGMLAWLLGAVPHPTTPEAVVPFSPMSTTVASPTPSPSPDRAPPTPAEPETPSVSAPRPVRVSRPKAVPPPSPPPPERPPREERSLGMRAERRVAIPRPDRIAPPLEEAAPPPPTVPRVTQDWVENPDGSFSVKKPGFSARIERDGKVSLHDGPPVDAKILLPSPGALKQAIGGKILAWIEDPYEYTRAMGRKSQADEEREATPGRPSLRKMGLVPVDQEAEANADTVIIPILVVRFDVTDMIMRLGGQDPYRAAKQKLLDDTREVRAGMQRRDARRAYDEALRELPKRLAELWARTDLPAAQRRRLLFLLWDESADASGDDDERAAAATRGRRKLERFVRDHLPEGSPDGYTAEELAALNAKRTSREEFRPYLVH